MPILIPDTRSTGRSAMKAILFDLDGVLSQGGSLLAGAWRRRTGCAGKKSTTCFSPTPAPDPVPRSEKTLHAWVSWSRSRRSDKCTSYRPLYVTDFMAIIKNS